jgi:uncharacterized repeat protein (TIGR03806 family)
VGRSREAAQILNAAFAFDAQGFTYADDTFGTNRPSNASGAWSAGQLRVTLNYTSSSAAKSGAWRYSFAGPGTATIAFDWVMRRANFEASECSEVRVTLDGSTYGSDGNAYVTRSCATGSPTTSGRFTFTTPSLAAGNHTLAIGGWVSGSNAANETLNVDIDNVTVDLSPPVSCGDGSCNGSESCTTCSADCGSCELSTEPFQEVGGLVVMEAESFSANVTQGGKSWSSVTDANASGGVAYQATPNTGTSINTGYVTGSPRLDFPVNFTLTGTYYVWVRGRDPDVPVTSNSDSVHAGIDQTGPASADRISTFNGSFGWSRATLDNANATLSVPSAGVHTIHLWMREDGFVVDKLLLTQNAAFTPTGTGPAQSPRGGVSGCGDGTCGAGETCASCVADCCGLGSRPSNTTCLAPAAPGTGYSFNRIWPNITFTEPVGLLQAPNDANTFFVVQKTGKVRALARTATMTSQVRDFLNLESVVDTGGPPNAGGEGGLLGVAFHPNYGIGGNFDVYVSYTTDRAVPNTVFMHRLSRFRSLDSGQTLALSTEQVLLEHPKTKTNHNAGDLAFGPDGYLYLALGDDAYQDPTRALMAADTQQRYGKILRLDVNLVTGYGIPPTNPFAGGTGVQREVFAYGFRNPWRFSFDRANGSLFLADVGEDTWEEIDVVTSGAFYGWPHREADQCRPSGNCSLAYTSPRETYAHNGAPKSITGGYVYRGTALPDLVGRYLYGDYLTGEIWAYDTVADTSTAVDLSGGPLSSFGQDNDGELYAVRFSSGTIEKLEASGPPGGSYPQVLGDTGCFSIASPPAVLPSVIPYSIALPFWSDGAQKERFLALPDGTTLSVASDGDFTLPPGAVTIKNFRHLGQLFETRFFVRHGDGSYSGYTYRWNEAQTQATLVGAAGDTRALPGLDWTYPSRSACMTCHTEAAGRSLGLETRQINVDHTYASTGRTANQLATLGGIGMLSGNLASLAPFAALDNNAVPIQERAKAYLHVNCSNCHRPGGTGRGPMDARFDTLFADMRVCDEPPTLGDLGVPGAMHLTPGDSASSLLWLRTSQRVENFMPPIASTVVDTTGVQRLAEWIDGLTSCPAPTGPLPCDVSGNEVANCNFNGGVSSWTLRENSGGDGTMSVTGGELRLDVSAPGTLDWHVQAIQILGAIPAGNYEIEFSARAAAARNIVVNLGQEGGSYLSRCNQTVSLTTTEQHFSITCNGVPAESNVKLDFNVGAAGTSSVFIDDVYFGAPR